MKPLAPPQWLTLQQAADRTQISVRTLQRWMESGYLLSGIHYGGSGKNRRFDPEMLDYAVRFQGDEQAHQQVIDSKRQVLGCATNG